jgi:hypothetical protein
VRGLHAKMLNPPCRLACTAMACPPTHTWLLQVRFKPAPGADKPAPPFRISLPGPEEAPALPPPVTATPGALLRPGQAPEPGPTPAPAPAGVAANGAGGKGEHQDMPAPKPVLQVGGF